MTELKYNRIIKRFLLILFFLALLPVGCSVESGNTESDNTESDNTESGNTEPSNGTTWIQTTQLIQYDADGTTEYSRSESVYDTEGKLIGSKTYGNGVLLLQDRDYQYSGRTATYWQDGYSNGSLTSSYKYKVTYWDKNWIQTTQFIIYNLDGTTEYSRLESSYDTEGKPMGSNRYINGVLLSQTRDYQYSGRTVTYWQDAFSNGSLTSSYKNKVTYWDKNWIQTTLWIQYAADGTTEYSRLESSYDTEGKPIGSKTYLNGVLLLQARDYQYSGRTATYWQDAYPNGSLTSSYKCKIVFR